MDLVAGSIPAGVCASMERAGRRFDASWRLCIFEAGWSPVRSQLASVYLWNGRVAGSIPVGAPASTNFEWGIFKSVPRKTDIWSYDLRAEANCEQLPSDLVGGQP